MLKHHNHYYLQSNGQKQQHGSPKGQDLQASTLCLLQLVNESQTNPFLCQVSQLFQDLQRLNRVRVLFVHNNPFFSSNEYLASKASSISHFLAFLQQFRTSHNEVSWDRYPGRQAMALRDCFQEKRSIAQG